MYNEIQCKEQAAAGSLGYANQIDRNPTVEENIDLKIAALRKEIERLEESKKTLSLLLAMKIRDIRDAMNY